jgi:prepilin-type N-terminal cleavage/methylation domain-containing protein
MEGHMDNKGFTLLELMIVMMIIAKRATRTEAYTNLEALSLLEEQFFAENGAYIANAGTCAQDNPGNVAAIKALLPGFKPGSGSSLSYSYCVEQNIDVNDAAATPCFKASAFGNTGTRVAGDAFAIDCNNERTF